MHHGPMEARECPAISDPAVLVRPHGFSNGKGLAGVYRLCAQRWAGEERSCKRSIKGTPLAG